MSQARTVHPATPPLASQDYLEVEGAHNWLHTSKIYPAMKPLSRVRQVIADLEVALEPSYSTKYGCVEFRNAAQAPFRWAHSRWRRALSSPSLPGTAGLLSFWAKGAAQCLPIFSEVLDTAAILGIWGQNVGND